MKNIYTFDVNNFFDPVLDLMIWIRNKIDRNKVVVKNTIQLYQFSTSNDREDDKLIDFNNDEYDCNVSSFGGSSLGQDFLKSG